MKLLKVTANVVLMALGRPENGANVQIERWATELDPVLYGSKAIVGVSVRFGPEKAVLAYHPLHHGL